MFADIKSYTLDNLILPDGLANRVKEDVQNWIDSRELYEQHGIPWKRGLILVGPPGNGKTHMIKALVNHFSITALYVRGFSAQYGTESQHMSSIFERARACTPCMLILEDLDSLVTPQNRSYFLNEVDGFAKNTGILAVATANNPEHLDPALVNRPSRFDRRYAFDLPEAKERARYLVHFTSRLNPELRLAEADALSVVGVTQGFSYAYLKELVLSSMMSWIAAPGSSPFVDFLKANALQLGAQMALDPAPTPRVELSAFGEDD